MKRLFLTLIACAYCVVGTAQSGYRLQYWFDGHYESHVTDTISDSTWYSFIDVSSIDMGLHTLHLHVRDTAGRWSVPHSVLFYNVSQDTSFTYTYWFDQNIGDKHVGNVGNGHLLLDVGGLSDGFHTLNMRVGNSFSATENSYLFYKESEQKYPLAYTCWFDNDYDNRTTDSIGSGHIVLNTESLDPGIHTVRVMIGNGAAATVQSYIFYNTPPEDSIYTYTYWFDQNIGDKHVGNVGNGHLLLDVGGLSDGFHTLNMRVGNSASFTENSYMFFIDAGLIKKYEYWFNEMDSLKTVVNLSPMKDTLKILSLLPVDTFPIRSKCFHFELNDDVPMVYAKNAITYRFWTRSKRFVEDTYYYVDYNVSDTVCADTLERNTTRTIPSPTANKIHWFKLSGEPGDSLCFITNRGCMFELFAPNGEMVLQAEGSAAVAGRGCHAWEKGVYYLAVHDASSATDSLDVTYKWVYKYAVLDYDVHEVGNVSMTAITFQGNGFDSLMNSFLVRPGKDTIFNVYIKHYSRVNVIIYYEFETRDTGWYDMVFEFDGYTVMIPKGIHVVPYEKGELLSYLQHDKKTSLKEATFTTTIINTGNTTAYKVPIYVYMTTPQGGELSKPHISIEHNLERGIKIIDTLPALDEFLRDSLGTEIYDSLSKSIKDNFRDDLYFFKFKIPVVTNSSNSSNSSDSTIARTNYFFCDIAPHDTMRFRVNVSHDISGHDNIFFDVFVPDKPQIHMLPPDYHYYGRPTELYDSNYTTYHSANSALRTKGFSKSDWCCIHDKVECALSAIGSLLSLTGVASTAGFMFSAFSAISSGISKSVCGEYVNPIEAGSSAVTVASGALEYATLSVKNNIISLDNLNINNLMELKDVLNVKGVLQDVLKCLKDIGRFVNVIGTVLTAWNCYKAWTDPKPVCTSGKEHKGETEYLAPGDPNDIYGYLAESGSHYVPREQEELYYLIEFENDPKIASANARRIEVRDTLDAAKFDLSSFAATGVTVGDRKLNVDNKQNFVSTIDMRPDINTVAQVELEYDSVSGIAHWTLKSLDPITLQEVTDYRQGLLPVNSGTNGIGTLSFIINRKNTLPDGDSIFNRASIVFDNEAAILTPTWVNILDLEDPVSNITKVVTVTDSITFFLHGIDKRSGLWHYTLYGRQDSIQDWEIMADYIMDSLCRIAANNGMEFYKVIAIDSAGNVEPDNVDCEYSIKQGFIHYYTVTVETDNLHGEVYGGGRYRENRSATLYAFPNYGYHFKQWNDGDTANPRMVKVNGDTLFTAIFAPNSYSITVISSDTVKGRVSGGGNYTYLSQVKVAATPMYGYHFIQWNDGDTNNPRVVTLRSDTSFTAVFDCMPYSISDSITICDNYTWHGRVYTASAVLTDTLSAINGCDSIVTHHVVINHPVHVAKTDTACETYTWNGKAYTVSGDYTYKHLDSNGCTQVDTLHLTVHHPAHVSKTDTACETYTWNGKAYTTSGDYTYKHLDANGCTQVDTLHLTVHHPVHLAKTDTACETYTWNGKVYSTSGDYTYKHLDANGCTQVDTLHLTVHHPVHVAKTDTACETYTWNGKVYTISGDYTYKHLDANGCTQVDTLHLTVNHPVHLSKTDTACETYTWNGKVYTASGDYTFKHLDANGCTQVDTLHLTVNHPIHVSKTDTACETYTWNGKVYTASGDYTYKHLDANGCTQVDTLHLTVHHPVHVAKTDTACETYTWNGKVYTTSGDYTYKHLDGNGCTQVDTLHLTVNHPVHVAKTDTACETYTWNGKVYTISGDYTYKHLDSKGCTQVDTLHLTVNHPIHVAKTDTACETYTWNGKVYNVSGDYTYKHLDANGCTQVDTLHLTVHHPIHVAKTDTACETYTWNGKAYTTSGDYTYTHLDSNGCTQVDTLHLTVHYNSVRNDTVEVCDRYTWHDSVFTESGVHQWHGFTVAGCDSTITLHLTINYSADTTITDTADNSYTWHDSVYTESGTYQWKGSTIAGCDSTVTLMLVIRHVGIEVIDGNGKKVRVYPNPTDGWLTIDADNILSIEVYDNTGRRVAEYGSTNRIDLSHLPLGGYVLKIRMERGVSIHHVIRN